RKCLRTPPMQRARPNAKDWRLKRRTPRKATTRHERNGPEPRPRSRKQSPSNPYKSQETRSNRKCGNASLRDLQSNESGAPKRELAKRQSRVASPPRRDADKRAPLAKTQWLRLGKSQPKH